jgi:hypothetical protein
MNKITSPCKSSIPLMENKYLITLFAVLQLIFILQLNLLAEIRYVSKTGSSTQPYTSWETAADSIQKCIDYSNSGDTIYVANGVYKETIIIKRGLSLIGSGVDSCIIDTKEIISPSYPRAVEIRDSCLIKNFLIDVSNYDPNNGYWNGTGIRVFDLQTPEIITVMEDNIIQNAHNAISSASNSHIRNNIIVNTESGVKLSGVNLEVYPQVINNYISSWHCIYIEFGSTPYIANNICIGPKAFTGSYSGLNEFYSNLFIVNDGLYFSDSTEFVNNVITGNLSTAIQVQRYGSIKNNAIINAENVFRSNIIANPVIQYNNIWNYGVIQTPNIPPIDSTNIYEDPMFVNDTSDFHLQMYSRLIDAGEPSILDKDGTRSDIGLFGGPLGENYTYQDLAPRVPVNVSAVYDSIEILIKWNKNTESDFSSYKVYRDTTADFQIDSTKLISTQTDTFYTQHIPSGINALYYKITAVDSQGNESSPSDEVSVILSSAVQNEPVVVYDYKLYQNYPNPFNPSTIISYRLKERGYVKLMVYDLKGELVRVLVNEIKDQGYYEEEFSAEEFSSGIYIYRIDIISSLGRIPVYTDVRKMVFIK